MSLFPVLLSFITAALVVSLFHCYLGWLFIMLVFLYIVVDLMYLEGNYDIGWIRPGPSIAFYSFLLAEFMVFASFLTSVMWFLNGGSVTLGVWCGAPIIGCMLLFSSTMLLEAFMGNYSFIRNTSNLWLVVYCGVFFLVVSLYEFVIGSWSFLCNPHTSSSIIAVLFHLSHVALGLVGLVWWSYRVSIPNIKYDLFNYLRFEYVTQYWHFVDFVWIFVYVIVYVR